MKKKVPLLLLGFWLTHGAFAQNHVFTGAEFDLFSSSVVNLNTPGAQTWVTDRLATPGYFSTYGASVYNNPSNVDYIDGYVKDYVTVANQGFTFPVGQASSVGNLRTLTTSGTIPNNSVFATAWIVGDPSGSGQDPTSTGAAGGAHATSSVGSGITAVSKVGEWDWQDLSATANGVTITVSIPDMTSFATQQNLRLVGWNGTQWINLSATQSNAAATGNTVGSSLAGTMQSSISAIGIGTVTIVLPLDLLSFTATESNCNALLAWTTANEVNTGYFEIQQSADGANFTTIGQVTAQGNGAGKTYSFTATQNFGLAYYRLKMLDKDGAFKYSPINSLHTNCSSLTNYMKLYPNPLVNGNAQVTLSFSVGYQGKAMLMVSNGLGQRMFNHQIIVVNGTNQFNFSTSMLASGIYYLQLVDANGKLLGDQQKLIKY